LLCSAGSQFRRDERTGQEASPIGVAVSEFRWKFEFQISFAESPKLMMLRRAVMGRFRNEAVVRWKTPASAQNQHLGEQNGNSAHNSVRRR
jgi:hypothetical protein